MSTDRSRHTWVVYAIDKRTGKVVWERVAVVNAETDAARANQPAALAA